MRGLDEAGGLVTGIAHKKNYTGKQRHILCTLLMISWAVTVLQNPKEVLAQRGIQSGISIPNKIALFILNKPSFLRGLALLICCDNQFTAFKN